ncbi:DUF86 domain-containing protein [soil metagenome]
MNDRVKSRLHSALLAAQAISEFIAQKDLNDYMEDDFLRSAVERKLEIIGEALNHAAALEPAIEDEVSELRAIVGLLNRLIHEYEEIDNLAVWAVARDKVPPLLASLSDLLEPGEE